MFFINCNKANCIVLALDNIFLLHNEIISTRKQLHFLKVFLSKTKQIGRHFNVIKVTLTKFVFKPYLINIRCSLSLKYVIQLEVP